MLSVLDIKELLTITPCVVILYRITFSNELLPIRKLQNKFNLHSVVQYRKKLPMKTIVIKRSNEDLYERYT